MNSSRFFDEIKIVNFRCTENHVTQQMSDILDKFGSDVQTLSIHNSIMGEGLMIELLNKFDKLDKLEFYDVSYSSTEKDDVKLMLSQLRHFNMQLCNFIIPRTIFRFPIDVLQSLTINNCVLDKGSMSKILSSQKSLKTLEFDPYNVDANFMAPLQLQNLTLLSKRNVIPIVKTQPNLNSLHLARALISDDEFLHICKMSQLQSLELWVDIISYDILDNLMSLKRLKRLSLSYARLVFEYVIKISTIFLPTIKHLEIEFPRLKMQPEHFIGIATNCPNVEHLVIKCQSIGVIGTIIQHFRCLRTLSFGCDSDSVKVVNFSIDDIVNTNLAELNIYDASFNNPAREQFQSSRTLTSLVKKCLPNLVKLRMENILSLNAQFFDEILRTKLSHLDVNDISDNFHFDEHFVRNILRDCKLTYLKLSKVLVRINEEDVRRILGCHRFAYVSCKEWRNEVVLRNCKWN
jgi:hypothetical protein